MFDLIAIIGSVLSITAALAAVYSVVRLRRDVDDLAKTLSSKGGDLPPSPDVEDPIGKEITAQMHEDDRGDD